MGRSAYGLDWLNKFPTQEQIDNLDPPPPLPMEPIILDPKDSNSAKDIKSTDEKSTK